MAATTIDLVRKFIKLDRAMKEKKDETETLKGEIEPLKEEIKARFQRDGVKKQTVDGVTVYVHRQLWARAANGARELAVEALKAVGLGEFIKEDFNTNTLSSWVREKAKAAEDDAGHPLTPEEITKALPEALHGALDVTEDFDLRARKG